MSNLASRVKRVADYSHRNARGIVDAKIVNHCNVLRFLHPVASDDIEAENSGTRLALVSLLDHLRENEAISFMSVFDVENPGRLDLEEIRAICGDSGHIYGAIRELDYEVSKSKSQRLNVSNLFNMQPAGAWGEVVMDNIVENSRFFDEVVGENLDEYNGIEVHGVRETGDEGGVIACEIDDKNPGFYSVYAHCSEGGIDCVGNFSEIDLARDYALEIRTQTGWPVTDFCRNIVGNSLQASFGRGCNDGDCIPVRQKQTIKI